MILQSSHQDLSNEGSNFILSLQKGGLKGATRSNMAIAWQFQSFGFLQQYQTEF